MTEPDLDKYLERLVGQEAVLSKSMLPTTEGPLFFHETYANTGLEVSLL